MGVDADDVDAEVDVAASESSLLGRCSFAMDVEGTCEGVDGGGGSTTI